MLKPSEPRFHFGQVFLNSLCHITWFSPLGILFALPAVTYRRSLLLPRSEKIGHNNRGLHNCVLASRILVLANILGPDLAHDGTFASVCSRCIHPHGTDCASAGRKRA